jgi:chitin synthase
VRNAVLNFSNSADTDPFFPYGEEVFQILRGLYVFSIFTMFITALGNRPQGAKWLYRTISGLFSLIMVLMLFMGCWAIKLQFDGFNRSSTGQGIARYLIENQAFRDLVVSVLSTYGLYLGASLIHLDPWHCFTSMVQYLLFLPTYNNIFMIYAFCNLHDVTWGTKGATANESDSNPIQMVTDASGVAVFVVDIPTDEDDVNVSWNSNAKVLEKNKSRRQELKKKRDEKTKQEDGTREFRTKVVLFWIFCNMLLIFIFTNDYSLRLLYPQDVTINPYLGFLFWSVAILSFIRFIGSTVYIVNWWGEKVSDAVASQNHRIPT